MSVVQRGNVRLGHVFCIAVGEPVLEFDVPELVERADLSQNASLVGVGEKAHELPRKVTPQCQPAPSDGERSPDCLDKPGSESGPKAEAEPCHESGEDPARVRCDEPDHEAGHEPSHEPNHLERCTVADQHRARIGRSRQIRRSACEAASEAGDEAAHEPEDRTFDGPKGEPSDEPARDGADEPEHEPR